MYQALFILISLAILLPFYMGNKKAFRKLKNQESVNGLFNLNEEITRKTKLHKADISILKSSVKIAGKESQFEINYDDITHLKLFKWYSNVFNAAVVEIKYQNNFILIAATSLVLFDNFVVGKRFATIAIYDLLASQCKNATKEIK